MKEQKQRKKHEKLTREIERKRGKLKRTPKQMKHQEEKRKLNKE